MDNNINNNGNNFNTNFDNSGSAPFAYTAVPRLDPTMSFAAAAEKSLL